MWSDAGTSWLVALAATSPWWQTSGGKTTTGRGGVRWPPKETSGRCFKTSHPGFCLKMLPLIWFLQLTSAVPSTCPSAASCSVWLCPSWSSSWAAQRGETGGGSKHLQRASSSSKLTADQLTVGHCVCSCHISAVLCSNEPWRWKTRETNSCPRFWSKNKIRNTDGIFNGA